MKVSVCEKCIKKCTATQPTQCYHFANTPHLPNFNNTLAVPSPCHYQDIPAGTEQYIRDIWGDSTHLSFYMQVECESIQNMLRSLKKSDKDFAGCETFLDSSYEVDSIDEFIKEAGTF